MHDTTQSPGAKRAHSVLRFRIAVLVFCTLGVALSADLVRLHRKVHTDPGYHSYCAISEWANCETVAASDHSVLLGLPVAVWGLIVYLLMGSLAAWGLRRPLEPPSWPFGLLFWLSAIGSGYGLYLLFVSHFVIESVCIVCIGTYLVNFALLAVTALEIRRMGSNPLRALRIDIDTVRARPRPLTSLVGLFVVASAITWAAVPSYWVVEVESNGASFANGLTTDGYPWIGAEDPTFVVSEFSDYQCPHCQRGHEQMRKLIQEHPQKLRLIHRHYPLDQACNRSLPRPFHPFACAYAELAWCAEDLDRFWEANDFLFTHGRRKREITADELAGAIGADPAALRACLDGAEVQRAVLKDLTEGQKRGIQGTPTFVIDGKNYPGAIPDHVLEAGLSDDSSR